MTIHHDKLAYGRLKGMREELSEDELLAEVRELNETADEEDGGVAPEKEPNGGNESEKSDT